jgi:hypothetical protein
MHRIIWDFVCPPEDNFSSPFANKKIKKSAKTKTIGAKKADNLIFFAKFSSKKKM